MRLWTIQHRDAYTKMLESGILRADNDHLFCEDYFRNAYDWMSAQMKLRISVPPAGVDYPVWFWHTWESTRKRPDMRRGSHAPRGTPVVLLTVDIPDEKVLLSDFDLWHLVLNGYYIADDEEDDDDRPYSTEEMQESWNKIFDVSAENKYYSESLSIQATAWELPMEWVKKVEHFIAK